MASSSKISLLLQVIWRENVSVAEMENLPVLTTLLDIPELQLLSLNIDHASWGTWGGCCSTATSCEPCNPPMLSKRGKVSRTLSRCLNKVSYLEVLQLRDIDKSFH